MNLRIPAELFDHRLVHTIVVVFDVVAADADSVFEILVRDRIAMRFERLDYSLAQPLTKLSGSTQPGICGLTRRRSHNGRNLLVVGWRLVEAALENYVESGEQCGQIGSSYFHWSLL